MARMERIIKKLWVVVIVLILLLFASNAAWIYYESQFVDESWITMLRQTTGVMLL